MLKWTSIALAVALVAGAGTGAYFWRDIKGKIKTQILQVIEAPPSGVMNILVIGTDSYTAQSKEDLKRFGRRDGKRADTIMLVQAVPAERRAAILSFPRDLWVDIAGKSQKAKINSAFQDGAQTVINTVTQITGIPVNHYVQVDFNGFRNLVESVGGIDVCLDRPLRDSELQFKLPAGVTHLDGNAALTFVRSRHADADGDFGRVRRQQQFLRSVVAKLGKPSVLLNPFRLEGLASSFASNVTTDREFRLTDMLKLAKSLKAIGPEAMESYTVPGNVGRAGDQSIVELDQTKAEPLFSALRNQVDPAKALAPVPIPIIVDDASGRSLGPSVADQLAKRGFQIIRTDVDPQVLPKTEIVAPRVSANDAKQLAALVPSASLLYGGTEVKLVIGSSFRALATPAAGEAPAPGGPCANFNPGG